MRLLFCSMMGWLQRRLGSLALLEWDPSSLAAGIVIMWEEDTPVGRV